MAELTKASTSRTVETARGTIHYQEAGEGYPLILMHGSGAGATGWVNFSNNIAELAEQFHVYAVDCEGWGDTYTTTFEQSDHVQMHIDFMDALGIEKAALVGNSMGGITAIRLFVRGEVPGLDADGFATAAAGAKENCPVSQALKAVPIELTILD